MQRTERAQRAQVAYQFELQSKRLGLSVLARRTNYRYTVHDEVSGRELRALILATSFDFYEYRLNRTAHHIDLLIVETHNAIVPLTVLSLSESYVYPVAASPSVVRTDAKRRNRNETALLISMMLIGAEQGERALNDMPVRTRQWYEQRVREYLKPRRGRPLAS